MEKLADSIIKFRWAIIIVVIAITAALGYQIRNLQINSDVISSLPDDDPDALLLKKIGREFGGNNMGMIILETDNIFQNSVLRHVAMITDSLKSMDGIMSVTSLTNIIDIKSGPFGIDVGKLVDEDQLPLSASQMDSLRQLVESKELYKGNIVSADGTATIVIFTLSDSADVRTIAGKVKSKTAAMNLPEKLYYVGSPMLVTYIADLISGDLAKLLPISFILIALVLFLSFRSKRGVILPLLTAAIAIVWTIGIMALAGIPMSMISNNIPIILLAVGSAYTIHVINRIDLQKDADIKKTIISALRYIFVPVILAALTTVIGFISFIFGAYLTMIKDFGIFTALGTFFSCLLSLIFVPVLISFMPPRISTEKPTEKDFRRSVITRYLLVPITSLLYKHPKNILLTWSILILVSLGGITLIKRSVDIREYFKKNNPNRIAEDIMAGKFGGTKPVFVLFKGDMQSPEVLNIMIETEHFMKQDPNILTTQSIADLIAALNQAMGGKYEIPESKEMIGQLWFLIDGNEMLKRFVNDDLTEGIVISKFISPKNKVKKAFKASMHKFISEHSSGNVRIEITGMPFVDITMDNSLLRSQLGSLAIAVIFVVIIVGLILQSLVKGIWAVIPIISTIIILFGVMGITGIPLNIATVLVASVTLGIGIDYSIHVISHVNYSSNQNVDILEAISLTIMNSGKAIVINVLSVSAGFIVLLFSQMVPLQYFGLLIALSMIGSSLGALTLLPAILILRYRRRNFSKKQKSQ